MPQASFGYFGMGLESVPGTAVAPSKYLPVKDVDFPISREFIEVREIRGSRQAFSNFDGPVRPDVSFTSALYPAGAMGYVLKGLVGGVSSAAEGSSATAKKHTFVDASTLPSYSVERSDNRTFGSGVLFQRLNGVKIESFGVTANYGEDVEVSVKGQGLGFPTTPGSKPGSFTYPAMDPLIFTGATISIDTVANNYFKSINFELTNELERQESLRGTTEAFKIYEGGISATLSGTMIFDDTAMYTKFKDSTSMAVEAKFTGSQAAADGPGAVLYTFSITFPKVKVSSFNVQMTAGSVLEADVEFQVSYDLTTSKLFDMYLINLDASGAYDT